MYWIIEMEDLERSVEECRPDIHKWCGDNHIDYTTMFNQGGMHWVDSKNQDKFIGGGICIMFYNEQDAVAFKLRWL